MNTTGHSVLLSLLCTLFALGFPVCAKAQPDKINKLHSAEPALRIDNQVSDTKFELPVVDYGLLPGPDPGLNPSNDRWKFSGKFDLFGGDIDYTGRINTVTVGRPQLVRNFTDLAMHTEYRNDDNQSLNYALYFGAGYHNWSHNLLATSRFDGTQADSLLEIYSWWSGFLGMKTNIYQSGSSLWLLDARFMQTFNPDIANEFNAQYDNSKFSPGERWGFRLSLPSHYAINNSTSLSFVPYAESIELGRYSTNALTKNGFSLGNVFDSNSKTINYGLSVALQQHF